MLTQSRIVAALALLFLMLTPASSVQAQLIPQPWPQPTGACPTAVVLDFSVSPRVSEARDCCTRRINYSEKEVVTEKDSRGWWLGRQDIYVNANIGRIAADLISEGLSEHGVYQLRSRGDLKIYYADKKDLLNKKFKMTREEINKAVLLLDPVSIGREMGVEKVVVGHICDSELRKAVAPGSFASVASFNLAVFDVATGRIEFQQCYSEFGNHQTQYFHFKEIAEKVARDLLQNRVGLETVQRYTARQ